METVEVRLTGGSFDGRLGRVAPGPASTLRLGVEAEGERWSELYMAQLGAHDEEGRPIFVMMERKDEE